MTARACVVAAAIAAIAATPGGAAAPGPTLTLVSMRPVTVQGTGFHARERIRVVLHAPSGEYRRRARAGASGAFSTQFTHAQIGHCERFSISATGRRGSHASAGRRAPVGCPPP
ncbi:MAG: hypothetical protein QOD71_3528 [Thermoleophilaceae bacterium]|jgi:hypothetical protein|nr:hypothetical protein [Thermoleophilaceae bacterium]